MNNLLHFILSIYFPGLETVLFPCIFLVMYAVFWKFLTTWFMIALGILSYTRVPQESQQKSNSKIHDCALLTWLLNVSEFEKLKRNIWGVLYLIYTEMYLVFGLLQFPIIIVSLVFKVKYIAEFIFGMVIIFDNISIRIGVIIALIESLLELYSPHKLQLEKSVTEAYKLIFEEVFRVPYKKKKSKKPGKRKHGR